MSLTNDVEYFYGFSLSKSDDGFLIVGRLATVNVDTVGRVFYESIDGAPKVQDVIVRLSIGGRDVALNSVVGVHRELMYNTMEVVAFTADNLQRQREYRDNAAIEREIAAAQRIEERRLAAHVREVAAAQRIEERRVAAHEREVAAAQRIEERRVAAHEREVADAQRIDERRLAVHVREVASAQRDEARRLAAHEREAVAAQRDGERRVAAILAADRSRSLRVYWDQEDPCRICGFVWLAGLGNDTKRRCCFDGLLCQGSDNAYKSMPTLHELPPYHRGALETQHFSRFGYQYNNVLALCSTGVDVDEEDHGFSWMQAPHSVALKGRLLRGFKRKRTVGVDFYINGDFDLLMNDVYDMFMRSEVTDDHVAMVSMLAAEQAYYNPHASDLKRIGDIVAEMDPAEYTVMNAIPRDNFSKFDISGIVSDDYGRRSIFITLKNSTSKKMEIGHSLYEPLSYPLLFPCGEGGWGLTVQNENKSLTFTKYLTSRLLCPENGMTYKSGTGAIFPTNRFRTRLGECYAVECMARQLDMTLAFHRNNQKSMYGIDDENDSSDDEDTEENGGQRSFLGQSFHGSKRHLQRNSRNALHVVSELGRPHIFLTLTTNTDWVELKESVPAGKTAYECPELTTLVFHEKLRKLLENLSKGKYFGVKKLVYIVRVIEYQHRGLPHAHIVFRLSDMPDEPAALCEWIDMNIRATLPKYNYNRLSELSGRDNELYSLVNKFMRHQCRPKSNNVNGCLNDAGVCSKCYDKTFAQEKTTFDRRGFPQYKRGPDDLKVVPHVDNILLDWKGHANVEFAGSTHTVVYLYKYLYKGSKKPKVDLTPANRSEDRDEISTYIRGRKICSMEVYWRLYGFQTYPSPQPGVKVIKVRDPSFVTLYEGKAMLCELVIYFNRPKTDEFTNLTFSKFYEMFSVSYKNKATTCETILCRGKPVYLTRRQQVSKKLIRLETISMTAGETFYLRVLLKKLSAYSFQDLKTYNGVVYSTFQASARANGLIDNEESANAYFLEIMSFSSPCELRAQFVTMTIQGYPTLHILDVPELYSAMVSDLATLYTGQNVIRNEFLKEIQRFFETEGKDMVDYGLQKPHQSLSEAEYELMKYNNNEQMAIYTQLEQASPSNVGQAEFIEKVQTSILESTDISPCKFIFLDGDAGTGKTCTFKKLAAWTRGKGCIVKMCSSTALAATLYDDCSTAHSLFKIPVEDDDNDVDDPEQQTLQLEKYKERVELIQRTKLILWDEAIANRRQDLEMVYNYKDFKHLKGKVVVLTGDFKQIFPIPTLPGKCHTLKLLLSCSRLWRLFTRYKLTENMRLRSNDMSEQDRQREGAYANLIKCVGKGVEEHEDVSVITKYDDSSLPDTDTYKYILRGLRSITCNDAGSEIEALSWLHSNPQQQDVLPTTIDPANAIICGSNSTVDEWNKILQGMNPKEEHVLLSKDKFADSDDETQNLSRMLTSDVSDDINHVSAPKHRLIIKVGDVCMLTRTLNRKIGLVNNARVRVIQVRTNSIQVQSLQGTINYAIPRIFFKFRTDYGNSFTMIRLQFPLRLAYAFTFNKAQGQTFNRVVLDVRSEVFSHGFLYVGMSRVRKRDNICFYVDKSNSDYFSNDNNIGQSIAVRNIVYKDVLEGVM